MKLKHIGLSLLLVATHSFASDFKYLLGASVGQTKNDVSSSYDNLATSYQVKAGFQEGFGSAYLAYNYVSESTADGANYKEKYQSALLFIDGMTPPAHFIGPMKSQAVIGFHAGMMSATVADNEASGFQYGLQGGANFPFSKLFSISIIYRYSFSDIKVATSTIWSQEELNVGANFTF